MHCCLATLSPVAFPTFNSGSHPIAVSRILLRGASVLMAAPIIERHVPPLLVAQLLPVIYERTWNATVNSMLYIIRDVPSEATLFFCEI